MSKPIPTDPPDGETIAVLTPITLTAMSKVRLKAVGLTDGMSFHMPLTQELIGDALGLTTIHVNRTLRLLREDHLIEIDGKRVTIVDFEALSLLSDFATSYLGELMP
jgi:hypothetical protein